MTTINSSTIAPTAMPIMRPIGRDAIVEFKDGVVDDAEDEGGVGSVAVDVVESDDDDDDTRGRVDILFLVGIVISAFFVDVVTTRETTKNEYSQNQIFEYRYSSETHSHKFVTPNVMAFVSIRAPSPPMSQLDGFGNTDGQKFNLHP